MLVSTAGRADVVDGGCVSPHDESSQGDHSVLSTIMVYDTSNFESMYNDLAHLEDDFSGFKKIRV